jgi:hypothetical protein
MTDSPPSPWNDHDHYLNQWRELIGAKDTVRADYVLELPGFLPGFWLTAGAAHLVHRAAFPCPARIGLKRLRQCVTFLFNRVWVDERLGAYAGHFQHSDLIVEAMSQTLVLDCGDPVRCHFVFALSENKLLAATRTEFPLEDDYWIERILFRSRLLNLDSGLI